MRTARSIVAAAFVALASVFALACPAGAGALNPGPFSLGDFQIGAAATYTNPAGPVSGLSGLDAASLQVQLAYGGGGTSINVYIQSSLDQGQTWFDIANIAFGTASGTELINLSGLDKLTTPTAPTNQTLANNTMLDGPIGDRLQAVVVTTGTYSGNTLVSVRGVAR
jgi:hypothetical protein